MSCNQNCGCCGGGCKKGEIELNQGEINLLEALGQYAFLPIARALGEEAPVYLEETELSVEEYSLILQVLEKKGLVSLDFDKPLKNFSPEKYKNYPILGSMALTAKGQKVLELLQLQGLS